MNTFKYTKEICHKIALKYNNKTDFNKNEQYCYNVARKNNWLNEICNHMILKIKPKNYWSKEKCKYEALKYNNYLDFLNNCPGACHKTYKNKWDLELCSHFIRMGNKYLRCIYAYVFTDNSVYIGLTYNLKNRNISHKSDNKSQVYKHIQITNEIPKLIQISDYINKDDAALLEISTIDEYKISNWKILNKCKGGGLGGTDIKWSKEKCQKEALKYETKKDFKLNCNGAYIKSLKNKWLDEICTHMLKPIKKIKKISTIKPKGYWTKAKCQEEALKYIDKKSYSKYSNSSYLIASRNNWIDEICTHMINYSKPKGYWTKDKCKEEALKYETKQKFKIGKIAAYNASRRNGWLDEFFI